MLKELHWFPVHLRVEFKILLITFKTLHDCATVYIKDLIKQYQPVHELRSSQKNLLVICEFTLKFYDWHAFYIVVFSVAEATLPGESGLPVLKKSPKNPKIPRKRKTSGLINLVSNFKKVLRFGKLTSKFPSDPILYYEVHFL